jgi:large subunit GTPase 1
MHFFNGEGNLQSAYSSSAALVVRIILPDGFFRRLQDRDKFLLTPFERNLEVWRQLWRVIERSHLIVQIVDARNPLRFRCEDLEAYVQDVEGTEGEKGTGKGKRKTLLLLNKADLLTAEQRCLMQCLL